MYIFIQSLSIVGMGINAISYLQKRKNTLIYMQLVSTAMYAIHFFLLGGMAGFLINVLGMIRAGVFSKREKLKCPTWILISIFCGASAVSYVLIFTVFQVEPTIQNFLLELLPVAGFCLTTLAYSCSSAKAVRRFSFFNPFFWEPYNIIKGSIGGMISEILCFISVIIGMIRHDLPKRNKTEEP